MTPFERGRNYVRHLEQLAEGRRGDEIACSGCALDSPAPYLTPAPRPGRPDSAEERLGVTLASGDVGAQTEALVTPSAASRATSPAGRSADPIGGAAAPL
jgi:hypothetical protein